MPRSAPRILDFQLVVALLCTAALALLTLAACYNAAPYEPVSCDRDTLVVTRTTPSFQVTARICAHGTKK